MTAYHEAGVDLDGADRHVGRISPVVTATWGPDVVGGFGGFAAGVAVPSDIPDPVLMMTTDGVGTKLELARRTGLWQGVGYDLVAMCVDDLAAVGARPIGFVDYLAVGALDGDRDAAIVESIAAACSEARCPLLGGETAEHPGVMAADQVDLAGTALGVVSRDRILGPDRVHPGLTLVGLASPNLRSNGFSLIRRLFDDLDAPFPGGDATVAEVLLEPSVIYSPVVATLVARDLVAAAAHVTGGGIPGNLVRVLPPGCRAVVDASSWEPPPVFAEIGRRGVDVDSMRRTFNLGIGFVLVVDPKDVGEVEGVVADGGHRATVIGEVVAGPRGVVFT